MINVNGVKLYTSLEAAEKLGVSRPWVVKAVQEKKIPCHRLSPRKLYFTDEDLSEIIQNSKESI